MDRTVDCIRCHAHMEAGLVVDLTQAGNKQQNWFPGPVPKWSFWMGLKVEPDQAIPVVTLRCPKCGYLESYANPLPVPGK